MQIQPQSPRSVSSARRSARLTTPCTTFGYVLQRHVWHSECSSAATHLLSFWASHVQRCARARRHRGFVLTMSLCESLYRSTLSGLPCSKPRLMGCHRFRMLLACMQRNSRRRTSDDSGAKTRWDSGSHFYTPKIQTRISDTPPRRRKYELVERPPRATA